jgi:FkbM family methyltransferase
MIRHAPGLRGADPLWSLLRTPYRWFLRTASTTGVEVKIVGQPIRLDPVFATVGWESIEPASYRAFCEAIQPGDLVFDVGAHVGTYSILAAKRTGPTGKVVAFEPTPTTREFLTRHLSFNHVADCVIIRAACCAERSGTVDFFVGPDAEAQNGLHPIGDTTKIQVAATTIDGEATAFGRPPDLVKIDVEGAEWQVLQGAMATLKTRPPKLLLSLHPDRLPPGLLETSFLDLLHSLGYGTEILARDHEVHVLAT